MQPVRTRIAPSPTGMDLHIGNAYTALINYVIARKFGGQFIIRIEDTDRTRLVEGSEQRILSSLSWLGIPHDEGPDVGGPHAPYRQSDRLPLYRKYAEELVSAGHAYYCFCTAARLETMRKDQEARKLPPMYDGLCKHLTPDEVKKRLDAGEPYVIRLNVPEEGNTSFTDMIRGEISFENRLIDDQVLLKSDGFPTYHLGVVVDDHLMGITHIFRGEEWISSTPKHILLYSFFRWDIPNIGHVSVLRNPDKSKLSKRKNPVWVGDYRAKGYLPEAVRNYLGTMAWSFPGGKEIFSVDEMVNVFEIGDMQTTAPVFDQEKLRWLNGEYLRQMDDTTLMKTLTDYDPSLADADPGKMAAIMPLVRDRMKVLSEFRTLAGFFFTRPDDYELKPDRAQLEALQAVVTDTVDFSHDNLEQAVRTSAAAHGWKPKDYFMQLRVAVTGKTVGPPLLESMTVLGREETIARLDAAIART